MRNALSWLLSILLHVAMALFLLHSVQLEPLFLEKILEVDLTQVEEPEPIIPMPVPEPVPMEQPVAEAAEELPAAAPLPMDKTVVLDDSPPLPPEPEPLAEPEPEPEAVEISTQKTLPPEEELAEDGKPKKIVVRKDITVHRGHEARFGRAMMGDYFSYSSKEFSGHFKTKDNRTISIIDARDTQYGRFLIYDSKNKTLRRLKQAFGKYVYTIGPSLYADEPVQGSVTFLAKNDRIERFILMTDDDRIAHYPRKVHVREQDTSFPGPAGDIDGSLTRPPYGDGHPGVVVVHGTACVDRGLVQGFTRSLSMFNLATLSFTPRGCSGDDPKPATEADLIEDAVAARAHMAGLSQLDAARVGLWGNGQGVPAALRAAAPAKAPFVVCLISDSLNPDAMPDDETLAALDMPVLWFITGRDTARWRSLIATLEALRDKDKKPFTIIVAPLKASQEVLSAEGDQSGWVEQVADNHASLAVSWIGNLKP
ncbi:alpha/beta hydrolase family protein [Pseudodesulfovibrio portus]|uniref:Alpha/beta hydrolase family protein n=1 Tax=Pseudodesulfovibrio portus TaxID=231439 RepID=A0ABN6RWN1_9BACT|nr:hypothetical protein [Pseudodesulfovibrio portus]BDQ34138.1 hypothetical protein JCM14722_16800 [Pseudodesulfovibrio portus]